MEALAQDNPWFKLQLDEELRVGLKGDWTIDTVPQLEAAIEKSGIKDLRAQKAVFHCGGLQNFDLSGAWILLRLVRYLEDQQVNSRYEGFRAKHFKFIDSLIDEKKPPKVGDLEDGWQIRWIEKIGRSVAEAYIDIKGMLALWGATLALLGNVLIGRKRLRVTSMVRHIEETGIQALPIVAVMAFMIAVVLSYQGANQLTQFGADIYTIDLVAISVLREMGVLLTAIMVAGRSGSAFAAEIGVMKLNEEIDAMKTIGVDPLEVLVVPRVLALLVSLPLLTLMANLMGFVGAALMSVTFLDLPFPLFLERLQDASTLTHFWVGMSKAPVFALIIAIVSLHQGFAVEQSAEDIGRYTTRAVVMTIFAVIGADAAFSIFYSELGL